MVHGLASDLKPMNDIDPLLKARLLDRRETEFLILGLREDGIIHIYMKPNTTLTYEGAVEGVRLVGEMGGGRAFPNLLDPQEGTSINKEARKFSKTPVANVYTLADAILVKNISHRLVGNAYVNFGFNARPTRLFTDREKALAWLKEYLPA